MRGSAERMLHYLFSWVSCVSGRKEAESLQLAPVGASGA